MSDPKATATIHTSAGDMAFRYELADGREGIALAFTAVPEPTATSLLGLCLLALLGFRPRRA